MLLKGAEGPALCAASRCARSRSCRCCAFSLPEGCAEAEKALGALRSGSLPWRVLE
jgi:hypothetical protein